MSAQPGSALLAAIRKGGGICPTWAEEITGERAHIANRRLPGLFRKGGMSGDDLREWCLEAGYLAEHEAGRAGGCPVLVFGITEAIISDYQP